MVKKISKSNLLEMFGLVQWAQTQTLVDILYPKGVSYMEAFDDPAFKDMPTGTHLFISRAKNDLLWHAAVTDANANYNLLHPRAGDLNVQDQKLDLSTDGQRF